METLEWMYLDPMDFDELERIEQLANLTDVVLVSQLADVNDGGDLRPLTFDVMQMNQSYLGGAKWESDLAPDRNNNHIRGHLTNVTGLDWGSNIIDRLASLGVVYVINYDPVKVHYPQLRTLSTMSTMRSQMYFNFAMAETVHVNYRVWCDLTGRNLTGEQLVASHKVRAVNLLRQVLDDRYQISFDVELSAADVSRGYSWTSNVGIIGKMPRLVKKLNIVV